MTLGGRQVDLRNLADTADEVRGKAIALLPQGAMNSLNPTRRVADLAYDVIRAHERRVSRGTARRRTGERLELLGLPTRVLDSYPHQLSGGMRQRTVAVVSTLLNPTVLVADEPTSALDVSAQRALLDLLRTLLDKEFISAIVFITHDLPLLSTIADRVAVMHAGQLAEIGPAGDMLGGPRHPYTQALVGTVLVPEPWVRTRRIVGISGGPPDLRQPPAGCRFHPRCPHALQVCREQEPPMVGTPDDHAACWWVHERSRDQAGVK
jgi:peptide/nickel transport system ATP-binding protein